MYDEQSVCDGMTQSNEYKVETNFYDGKDHYWMEVSRFKAGWGTNGRIEVRIGECDVCKKVDIPVIAIDSSDMEYGSGHICEACAMKVFSEFKRLKNEL